MKEVLGSLPEVITAYKNYNLLVPTATDVQLNPFYKFHVEEVPVDLGETSGDIFKVGSVKTGKQDERGKDIWEDVFSFSDLSGCIVRTFRRCKLFNYTVCIFHTKHLILDFSQSNFSDFV